MQHLAGGGRPLYGRFTWSQRLKPFDYSDAALMMHGRPAQDCALLYGTFGGTPRYLAAIRSQETPAETIKRTMLSPNGEVQLQLQMLIEQEQGIRDTGDYRAVLAAVAQGCTELNDIAMRAGLQSRPYVVRRILHVLGELELIYKERNFGAASKAPYRYRIADPAVRFWYTFVYANRLALETGNVDSVWRSNVAPRLTTYMGLVYERIVAQAYRRYSQTWKMPAAHEWSRWEGTVRSKRSIEIDLVAQLEDGRILSGEIKSRSAPMSVKSHYQLMHHLEDIANSGHGWAHDALSENQSAGYLYFSVSGFEANFRQLAKSDSRIHLLGLEDLYPSMG
jgi:hypothetical protein